MTCVQVTAKELLQRCLRRDKKREASASCTNPILLIAPKPEPIEISSDSNDGNSPSRFYDDQNLSDTVKDCRLIEVQLLWRRLEVDQLAREIDDTNRLATEASKRAATYLHQFGLTDRE